MTIPAAGLLTVLAEVDEDLYPDQDLTDGNFVEIGNLTNNTDLYTFVDDDVTPDTEGITTEAPGGGRFLGVCGSPTDEQTVILGMPDFTDPPAGTETFELTFRGRRKDTVGSGHTVEGRIAILQGASTVIAEGSYQAMTTSFVDYDLILSSAENLSLLSDTSDMRIRVRARGCVSGIGDEADFECTMMRLRVQS